MPYLPPSLHYHFVKAQLWGNSICRWKHKNRRNSNHKNSLWRRAEIIPTKCIEVHFSQRLILGEWSWSLHRATEKVATVPVYESKNEGKTKCIKNFPPRLSVHSASECNKNGWEDKRVTVCSAVEVLLWKAQPLEFPSLKAEKFIWQDFLSIPVLLMGSACRAITAQQCAWWLKGGEGGVRGGRNGGGEAVGPALPALGPALAGNCNSSSGGKVSSAWLPLASPKCLPLCSRLYPQLKSPFFVLILFLFSYALFFYL